MNNNLVKISLLLNGLLIIAVAVLFYLHFKQPASASVAPAAAKSEDTASIAHIEMPKVPNARRIVFFNYDSLSTKYEFFQKIEREMEGRIRNIENELMKKEQKLQEDYEFYQKNGAAMTEQHRESKERELMAAQQELVELKEKRTQQLALQEQELNQKLMDKLYGYFSKLSKENNFDYILTYKKGVPGVVFGTDSLDITSQLIEGLNKDYRQKK